MAGGTNSGDLPDRVTAFGARKWIGPLEPPFPRESLGSPERAAARPLAEELVEHRFGCLFAFARARESLKGF
jgi:hypothetical protein